MTSRRISPVLGHGHVGIGDHWVSSEGSEDVDKHDMLGMVIAARFDRSAML